MIRGKSLNARVGDVADILSTVRHFNEAVFLAAHGFSDERHRDAVHAVTDIIEVKLLAALGDLDAIMEELA